MTHPLALLSAISNEQTAGDLIESATRACVVFDNQQLPAGSLPPRARLGIEASPHGILVHVNRGIIYTGDDPVLRNWLAAGSHFVACAADLRGFLRRFQPEPPPLDEVMRARRDPNSPAIQPSAPGRPAQDVIRTTEARPSHDPPRRRSRAALPTPETELIQSPCDVLTVPSAADIPTADELLSALVLPVRGQRRALEAISRFTEQHLVRVERERPLSVLLCGNTGTGKSLAGATLGQVLGERLDYRFLRVDLNEYREEHRISQLLGAPPGYLGSNQRGILAEAFQADSRVVLLLDEVEKAHPTLLLTLMALIDEGRVPDASANADRPRCTDAVVLFTSNNDAQGLVREAHGIEEIERVDALCRRRFAAGGWLPEVTGRIGRFVVFEDLDVTSLSEVVITAVMRAASSFGLQAVDLDPSLVAELIRTCRDSAFGARTVNVAVESRLGRAFVDARRRLAPGTTVRIIVPSETHEPVIEEIS